MNNLISRLVTENEIYSNHGKLEDILYQGIHCSDFTSGWENSFSPAGNFRFKVNDRNTKTRCQICTKLTIKTPDKFEHILYLVLVQICELTRIERVSPAFRSSHPHENLSFTSPALPMFHPHSLIFK